MTIILNQKASPLNPGGSCGFGQSEIPWHRIPALENQEQGWSYKHALDVCADNNGQLSAEMCDRANRHLVAPAAGDAVGAGGRV